MLSKIISEKNVQAAWNLIQTADNVAIISHVGPDGDAVGSSLGMYHFLKKIGKNPTVILPNQFPSCFSFLKESEKILIYEFSQETVVKLLKNSDLIVMIDFNTLGRIDGLKPLIEVSKAKKILLDHHPFPDENIADVVISHPEISSSSEVVFRLICRMGFFQEISLDCAEAIYAGMSSDTGGFSYNSNQPEIYTIISELLKKGIDKDLIYKKLNYVYSENRMRLMGYCLNEKMRIYPEFRAALIALSEGEMARFEAQTGDTEGFVNLPFSIKNIVFSVFLKEDKQRGKVKISLRSQGDFPANEVASAHFSGGGHLNAAGGDSTLPIEKVVEKFEKILPQYEEKLKNVKI